MCMYFRKRIVSERGIPSIENYLYEDHEMLQEQRVSVYVIKLLIMCMYFRKRIVSERGIPSIEHYLYEDHEMLQRAACECICNKGTNNVYVFQKEDSI